MSFDGGALPFLGVALVFGVVNAFIRPVAKVLTFPLIIVTLGMFALVVNGLMLWLTSSLSAALGLGFRVQRLLVGVLGRAGRQHREHDPVDADPRSVVSPTGGNLMIECSRSRTTRGLGFSLAP